MLKTHSERTRPVHTIRRLAALVLVGVILPLTLIVTTTAPAEAITTYGPAVQGSFHDGSLGLNTVDCTFSAYWQVHDASTMDIRVGDAKCAVGALIMTGEHRLTLQFRGTSCTYAAWTGTAVGTGVATKDFPAFTAAGLVAAPFEESCSVNEVCYSYKITQRFVSDTVHSDCVTFSLGLPPGGVQTGECAWGSLNSPVVSDYWVGPGGGGKRTYRNASVKVSGTGTAQWIVYLIIKGNYAVYPNHNSPVHGSVGVPFGVINPGQTYTWSDIPTSGTVVNSGPDPSESAEIIGIGAARLVGTRDTASKARGFPTSWPSPWTFGVTHMPECQFYFGKKTINIGATEADEPFGPLPIGQAPPATEPPSTTPVEPPAESGCEGFSFTDPSSWAGAGICLLVKLVATLIDVMKQILGVLKSVLSAIAGLASAIISGLINGFKTLWIPDLSNWNFNGVRDQWDSRPPGSLVNDGVEGVNAFASGLSGSGQCGALPSFQPPRVGGSQLQLQCDGFRGISGGAAIYALVQMGLIGITLIYVWQILIEAVRK